MKCFLQTVIFPMTMKYLILLFIYYNYRSTTFFNDIQLLPTSVSVLLYIFLNSIYHFSALSGTYFHILTVLCESMLSLSLRRTFSFRLVFFSDDCPLLRNSPIRSPLVMLEFELEMEMFDLLTARLFRCILLLESKDEKS